MDEKNHSNLNCVLKSWDDVVEAKKNLNLLGLPPHPDTIKSWDTWKIINFTKKFGNKESHLLDVGCNGSPILPYLRLLGFHNLYGCDVDLEIRKRRFARRILNKVSNSRSQKILDDMLLNKDNFYNLMIQDLEKTNYDSEMFNFISSLSVIEHGVNINNYFLEMSRILKNGGYLLTSTDYWPEKIEIQSNVYQRPGGDVIFNKNEIENLVTTAKKHSLNLCEPIDYSFGEKVVHWKKTGKDYTFIFFCLQKST